MGLQPTRERFKSFHFAEAALQNNDSSVDDIASQSPCRHGLFCDAFQSIWKLMRMYGPSTCTAVNTALTQHPPAGQASHAFAHRASLSRSRAISPMIGIR